MSPFDGTLTELIPQEGYSGGGGVGGLFIGVFRVFKRGCVVR